MSCKEEEDDSQGRSGSQYDVRHHRNLCKGFLKQRKELLAIAEETLDPQEARKSIFAKLKDFGEDVAANIVANIMTNPQVWQNIGSLL